VIYLLKSYIDHIFIMIIPFRYILILLLLIVNGVLLAQPTLQCPACTGTSLVACSGANITDYMDVVGEVGATSYIVSGDILNPGTQNSFGGFILSDVPPIGSGSINIIANSGNGQLNTTVTVTFVNIQASFGFVQSNTPTCYSVAFNNTSSIATGLSIDSYNWNFGFSGGMSNLNSPTVTFPGPGSYNVTLTATDNGTSCSSQLSSSVFITGPNAWLSFEGNGFLLDTMVESIDTCVVPFCVANNQIDYSLLISDASANSGNGSNTQFVFDDLQVPGIQSLPYNIVYSEIQTGYSFFKYTVTDNNGCSDQKIYAVYKSDLQNVQFTCAQQGTQNYCVGQSIPFETAAWTFNPADVNYSVQFICESTGQIIFEATWQDVPPNTFNFTPTITSCGCNSGNSFLIKAISSSPCDPPGLFNTTYFSAGFPADAEFITTDPSPACLNESVSFDWIHDNGFMSTTSGPCKPQFNWTITNLDNNSNVNPTSGDNTAHIDHTFSQSGLFEVRLDMTSGCGSDFFLDTICILPAISAAIVNATINWNIPATIICSPEIISPEITSYNSILCEAPTFTWRLYKLPNLTAPINTLTGLSPDFNINSKGEYKFILTAQVADCGSVVYEQLFNVASTPVINVNNPIYNACSATSICLDDLFCIDTCLSSLVDFNLALYSGAVNCNAPVGASVFDWNQLPQNHILSPCSDLATCQYNWVMPVNPNNIYTLVINASNGCGAATAQCITINIGQAIQDLIPDSVCMNTQLNSNSYFPPGAAGCGFEIWNGTQWIDQAANITITGEAMLLLQCSTGCPLQDTIHVFPTFVIDAVPLPPTICAGDYATITVNTTPASANITQYEFSSGINILQTGASNSYNTVPLLNSAAFDIEATDANNCMASAVANVSVESNPVFNCNGFTFCESDITATIDLTSLLTFNGSYPGAATWTLGGQSITGTSITVAEILLLFPMADADQNLSLEYTFITPAGCTSADFCNVLIQHQGVNAAPINNLCANQIFTLNAGVSADWDLIDLPASAGSNFNGSIFNWTPLPIDIGDYTITVNTGCAITEYPISVHYYSITASANDLEICMGESVELDAAVVPANTIITSYQWNALLVSNTALYVTALNTSASFTIQATDEFGCTYSDDVNITVEALPILNCSSILSSYCETSTAQIDLQNLLSFESNYPASAEWTICGSPVIGTILTVPQIVAICGPVNADITYELAYTLMTVNDCYHTDTCTVNIENEDLEVEHHYLCSGDEFSVPGNGQWNSDELPASAPSSGSFNNFIWSIPIDESPDEYVLTFSAGCGVTEFHIHVNATPIPGITLSDNELCIEGSVMVVSIPYSADSSAYNYNYSSGSIYLGSIFSEFVPETLNLQNTDPGEICLWASSEYTLPDNNLLACINEDCEEVNVIDIPGLPDAADELCFEQPFAITGDFDSFVFEIGGNNYTGNDIIIPDLTGLQPYQLTIEYGGDYNCLLDTASTVYIQEPIEYLISFESDSCTGNAQLQVDILQGENLNYQLTGDVEIVGETDIMEGTNNLQFSTSITDDTTYPFSLVIDNGGCDTETWEGQATVYAAPDLLMDVSAGSTLCNGETVCFDVVNVGSSSVTDVIFDMGNDSVYNYIPEPVQLPCTQYFATLNAVTYTVTGTLVGVCVTDVFALDVTIQPSDVLVTLAEYPNGFCAGDTIDLTPVSVNGVGPFDIDISFIPEMNPQFVDDYKFILPEGYSNENVIVTVGLDGNCGADQDITTFYIKQTPITEAYVSPMCQGEEVSFTNISSPLEGDFSWQVIGGNNIAHSTHFSYTFPDNSDYTVILTQQIEEQCLGVDTIAVSVTANPTPEIHFVKECYLLPDEVIQINSEQGYASYIWQVNDSLFNANDYLITGAPLDMSGNFSELNVHLTVTDNFGCTSQTEGNIALCNSPIVHVPNCFTPDNDGINDLFCTSTVNLNKYLLMIHDRWGQKVFETNDIDECWTGSFKGSNYFVPDGLYAWTITYNAVDVDDHEDGVRINELAGFVIIIR
jgi:gliding motility-associated-like protein